MQRKNSLHPFAIGDAAHGEGFVDSGAFAANHDPGKYLDPLFVTLDDTGMHPHTIAHFEFRDVALLLLFANSIDDVHRRILRWKRGRIRSAGGLDCKALASARIGVAMSNGGVCDLNSGRYTGARCARSSTG